MENLHLIAGLGNPGEKYSRTRHNIGFMLVEELGRRWRVNWNVEKKFQARVAKAEFAGKPVWLCQPQTFMNLSGEAIGALVDFYQVPIKQTLVATDDADLPFGELRLRGRGSSGGHHGLGSIEQHVATREFARLKIGIGRTADGRREISDYVLAPFKPDEMMVAEKILDAAAKQVETWLTAGIEKAMNQFNGLVVPPA